MPGINTGIAIIEADYAKGMSDFIANAVMNGDRSTQASHSVDIRVNHDSKTINVKVEGMDDKTLADILTGLDFRLLEASAIKELAPPQMPLPTLIDNKWNTKQCLNWLESVMDFANAAKKDPTKTYLDAMRQLRESFDGDERTTGDFMTELSMDMATRAGHDGITHWQHSRGIRVEPADSRKPEPQQRPVDDGDRLAAKFLGQ